MHSEEHTLALQLEHCFHHRWLLGALVWVCRAHEVTKKSSVNPPTRMKCLGKLPAECPGNEARRRHACCTERDSAGSAAPVMKATFSTPCEYRNSVPFNASWAAAPSRSVARHAQRPSAASCILHVACAASGGCALRDGDQYEQRLC